MSDYRISIKVRNANLLRAIEDAGYNVGAKFAALCGVSYQSQLLEYVSLKRAPFDADGNLKPCAEKLCAFLKKMPNELWTDEQCYPLEVNSAEVDVSSNEMMAMLSHSSPMAALENKQMIGLLDRMLDGLSPRESEVINMRFGIDCEPKSLEQIGAGFDLSSERVRQIELKALAKLRTQISKMPRSGVSDLFEAIA